jgi:hypothetical protein
MTRETSSLPRSHSPSASLKGLPVQGLPCATATTMKMLKKKKTFRALPLAHVLSLFHFLSLFIFL